MRAVPPPAAPPRETAPAGLPPAALGEALRGVMRRVPSPVTVVTAAGPGGLLGAATIGSFTSLSLVPPLVSFNVLRATDLEAALAGGGRFVVHVLRDDQAALAERFARPDLDAASRLALAGAVTGPDGQPRLPDALARLHGQVRSMVEAGDHVLVVGEVDGADGPRTGAPLVYLDRAFRRVGAAVELAAS